MGADPLGETAAVCNEGDPVGTPMLLEHITAPQGRSPLPWGTGGGVGCPGQGQQLSAEAPQ
jgi:hypothetical protein